MEYYKNLCLENLSEVVDGILIIEEWKDIPGYEGLYQASTFGRLKTLEKTISCGPKGHTLRNTKILKILVTNSGYIQTRLSKNGKGATVRVHRLITNTFLGPSDLPIDHKNRIKTDNRLINLEYVSHRENVHRYARTKNRNLPIGVILDRNRYVAQITHNKKHLCLGRFKTIEEASTQYNSALNDLDNIDKYVIVARKSKYGAGIQFRCGKYSAEAYVNKKKKYLGTFNTKEEASAARMRSRTNPQS